jgi:Protein of unknown function (DUF3037)
MTMLSYSIVRYVPDPRREEFLNVGLIVVSDDNSFAECRFTTDWRRARRFGTENLSFLKTAARQIDQFAQEQRDLLVGADSVAQLENFASEWQNSIQFSPPRASVHPHPHELVDNLFEQYIEEHGVRRSRLKGKRPTLALVHEVLDTVVFEHFATTAKPPEVLRYQTLNGNLSTHRFDFMVKNGKPLLCVDVVSPAADESELDEQVRATAFDIRDVREKHPKLPLCVVLSKASDPNSKLHRMYKKLGATVTEDDSFPTWAKNTVGQLSQ